MELYNDDCFNVFPKIKDNTIDLFVLDLPYANKDFGKCTACKWDNTIDLDKMWVEIKRIMKPNAVIIFFCNTKFGFSLIKSNMKWFRYDLIFKKSRKVGFLSANRAPLRQHENIYVFSDADDDLENNKNKELRSYAEHVKKYIGKTKTEIVKTIGQSVDHFLRIKSSQFGIPTEKTYNKLIETYKINDMEGFIDYEKLEKTWKNENETTYNPQKTEGKPYKTNGRKEGDMVYGSVKGEPIENKGDRHPTSIYPDTIDNTILEHNNPKKSLHRTQKPVSLCEWLIKTYSNEKDTVMDFTMGSGTTGVACKHTNRNFIGVEMDKEIFKIAKDRLEKIDKIDKVI